MKILLQLFILCCFSCCIGQVSTEDRLHLPRYATFYWIDNSEKEFYALNFDSASCNLFSFGQGQPNSARRFAIVTNALSYNLEDPSTGSYHGNVTIVNDTSLVLLSADGKRFQMISDAKFEKLFSILQSRYSYKCIQSDEISINGIVPERTSAKRFLSNAKYKQRVEKLEDEIYGTETHTYLEYNGNRFYYVEKGEYLFDKIEVTSNDVDSIFLDIRIGDTYEEVLNKLKPKITVVVTSKSEIKVRICNSRYVGSFGHLLFKFRQPRLNSSQVLEKITCQPFDES